MRKKTTKKRISKKKSRKIIKKQKGGQSNNYSDYKICFFNSYQNGDIYISSQFVIDIKNKVKNDIAYYVNLITKDSLLYVNNIFASQSDIIVGLASGLFITTYSKETLNKKFIMISPKNHIVYEKFNSYWIKNDNIDNAIKEIETIINK
jgi:hypothetical protein